MVQLGLRFSVHDPSSWRQVALPLLFYKRLLDQLEVPAAVLLKLCRLKNLSEFQNAVDRATLAPLGLR